MKPVYRKLLRRIPGFAHIAYLRRLVYQAFADEPVFFDSQQKVWIHEAPVEQERYRRILESAQTARGNRRGGRALEIGCARGLFTARLAEVFDSMDAYDILHTHAN